MVANLTGLADSPVTDVYLTGFFHCCVSFNVDKRLVKGK